MKYILWFLLLLITASAHADRDIVYAARYYTPPGSHRTSHFHLYRINPNGTGRIQLTFGDYDDGEPQWSPDGRWILFSRYDKAQGVTHDLIHAAGGHPVRLQPPGVRPQDDDEFVWSPDSKTLAVVDPHALLLVDRNARVVRRFAPVADFVWSPDGRRAYITVDDTASTSDSRAEILTLRTGTRVPIPKVYGDGWWTVNESALWAGNKYLIGILRKQDASYTTLGVCNMQGHLVRVIVCHWPSGKSDPGEDAPDLGAAGLLAGPVGSGWNVWAEDNSISSWIDFLYSRVGTKKGRLTYFAEGQFLVFSPFGQRFCVARHRAVIPYARRADGTERLVWAAPLQVETLGGKLKTITPGLVWVTGADWRKQ